MSLGEHHPAVQRCGSTVAQHIVLHQVEPAYEPVVVLKINGSDNIKYPVTNRIDVAMKRQVTLRALTHRRPRQGKRKLPDGFFLPFVHVA